MYRPGERPLLSQLPSVGFFEQEAAEKAERLGVHESQVSRDERNEYHGVTLERASRILEALGFDLRSVVTSGRGVAV